MGFWDKVSYGLWCAWEGFMEFTKEILGVLLLVLIYIVFVVILLGLLNRNERGDCWEYEDLGGKPRMVCVDPESPNYLQERETYSRDIGDMTPH